MWKTDGTPVGTVMVKDIYPGPGASGADLLINANGTLYFRAYDGTIGSELWKSDGTAAGTVMVKDINPGAGGSYPGRVTNVLYFSAADQTHGFELWKSDGTTAGTLMVKDINPGIGGTFSSDLTNSNGTLFFGAADGTHGYELWKSNGTSSGTIMVKDITPGSTGGLYSNTLTDMNGTLYFTANDGTHGWELWKSNGTDAGTVMVKQINPYQTGSYPGWLTTVNGKLFFQATDGVNGVELWKSNGTDTGTVMIEDIKPGPDSSNPHLLTNINGTLYFAADDGTHGSELWGFGALEIVAKITSITDVPNDQGGDVRLKWRRSFWDVVGAVPQIASYGVWRKIPPGVAASREKTNKALGVMNDTLGLLYDFIGEIPAVQSPQYNIVAPTLADSSSTGTHRFTYLVTAHTSDPNVFYISLADSGYSVDNLAPSAVQSVTAQTQAGPSVSVQWSANTVDRDVGFYEVHRASSSGFTPGPSTRIGQTRGTALVDSSPVGGVTNYYRIVTVDIHDNHSSPSAQASAIVTTTQTYSVISRWNMVSVPLTVTDYAKSTLYPAAVSQAFAYEGSYVIKSSLKNGSGYWLKFNGNQSVSMTGYLRSRDTINVSAGWNMIGSISDSILVSQIASIPGGLVTSQFFGYSGTYVVSSTVVPGSAYWVKVNQDGKLLLQTSAIVVPSKLIRIVPMEGQPPPLPDRELAQERFLPSTFRLDQNYPNPFNPATTIRYALSEESRVTLKVYNMFGQELKTLADGIESAGSKAVSFEASTFPTGVYFYLLQAGRFVDVKRMVLIR